MKKIILILLLIGFSSISNAQALIKVIKTTWYINGVKKDKVGNFWGISFASPYVYFFGTKNNEEGKVTIKWLAPLKIGVYLGLLKCIGPTNCTTLSLYPLLVVIKNEVSTIKMGFFIREIFIKN